MKKEDGPPSEGPPGPYHILKRYRGIGGGLGRLYEARNNETGNAALVLMPAPGGDLRPEEDWQVRATSSVTPPYLALEVERAPEGGQAEELTWMLDLWATALVRIDERPETQAHLSAGARKPPPRPGARLRWPGGAVAAAALLALGVFLKLHTTPEPLEHTAPSEFADNQPPAVLPFLTDGAEAIARSMPEGPFKGQSRPPCKSRFEVEIRGGCWVAIEARPPCGNDAFEHAGKCYLPMFNPPRPPQAIQP